MKHHFSIQGQFASLKRLAPSTALKNSLAPAGASPKAPAGQDQGPALDRAVDKRFTSLRTRRKSIDTTSRASIGDAG
jgi:hypothetical protein